MTAFLLLLALAGALGFYLLARRLALVEAQLRRLESLLEREHAAAPPAKQTARAAAESLPAPPPIIAPEPAPEPAAPALARFSLETLIGGRLPIWIGGAALVLAGVFLVRYSIETGLLGPGARTLLAALFGAALVGASEAARRLPATAQDPRVAQSLAGAGVASLYGTLYMAAALYHLIAPLPGFGAVLLVTGAALVLSLRHGPPTAVMALVGGFAAPLVAGFDAAGVGPLIAYLALFTAALFGLAVHRGWAWLAIAASVAGFGWTAFLVAMLDGRAADLSAVGFFAMLLALGASIALPATGARRPWLRLAPLVAGFVQLLALAPALDFAGLAWGYYLVLAAAALFLARRNPLYLPGAQAALALLLALLALALLQGDRDATPAAAVLAALLFALPGHALATRRPGWAALALGGTAGPLLVLHLCAPSLFAPTLWGAIELAAALAAAHLAWRLREQRDGALAPATATAALLAAVGMAQFVAQDWLSLPLALVMVALAAWARHLRAPALAALPAWPFFAALVLAALPLLGLLSLVAASLGGDRLPYVQLPGLALLLKALALPTAALLVMLADPGLLGRLRRAAGIAAILIAILLLYALAKQLLAIDTLPRFAAIGFVERALLTQACLAAGWLLLRHTALERIGAGLLVLGGFRFLWFDLLLLDPLLVPQSVGGIPLVNAAVLHAGLTAFWFWTLPPHRAWRAAAAVATLAAGLIAVRQAAHGDLLTGPLGTAESSGYSAVLLGIALFWLWRGISAAQRDLRVAGLALLTLVTFKVFLIDAAALDGVLRILSFLGLGVALIGIGWAYGRFLGRAAQPNDETPPAPAVG